MKDKDLTVILSVLIGIPAVIAFLLLLVLFPTFVNRENIDKRNEVVNPEALPAVT